ncbi:single-stranded DNA-binding protein, partial [Xylella fastidiosa subsp. multiplex]|nr:single-stranded DNA-binding protein [Xylella fastidiosa subsp. multiplex]
DEIVKTHEEAYAAAVAEFEANPPQVQRGKKPLTPYEGDLPFFDNGDGTTTFKFKCYASFQDKKTKETKHINLVVVDSKGKKIQEVPIIGGGSKLKVKYSLVPYKWNTAVGASAKLQLESVMLVELATFGGGGEDEWADEVEDGGYTASESRQSRDEQEWQEDEHEETPDDDEDF